MLPFRLTKRYLTLLSVTWLVAAPVAWPDTDSTGLQLSTQVSGLTAPGLDNVEARLKSDIQDLTKPISYDSANGFYQESDATVMKGLAPYSYFSPTIHKSIKSQDNQHWILQYQVDPGPISLVTVIDIQLTGAGAEETALQQLIHHPPLQIQRAFSSEAYQAYKEKLLLTAQQLGYINAFYSEHQVLINREQRTVEIHLSLDTEKLYYFGVVHFQKNPLSNTFLQRFVPFQTGQRFSPELSDRLQTNLNNSGYYQQVEVMSDINAADGQQTIPTQVNVTPKPRQQYILGGGYGTDTGPRVSIGSNWNYINDMGHQLTMMARLSQVQSTFISKYIIPGANPLEDQANINASLLTNNINQGSSQTRQLGVGFNHNHNGWQRTLSLSYQIEHYSFNSDPYQTSHLLIPSLNYQKTYSDNPLAPTRGNSFNFLIQGAKAGVLADTNFIQGRLQEKWLYPLTDKSQILLKADLGYTAIHDENLLPLSLSFFAGGAQSIRGYGYNVLGPGRYLIVSTAEYRHQIVDKWYGATFIDVGNAFDNLPSGSNGGLGSKLGATYNMLQRGVGVGVGWNSPVGPLQLSLAQAVNEPGRPNRIQFTMGAVL